LATWQGEGEDGVRDDSRPRQAFAEWSGVELKKVGWIGGGYR
jgi:hypothetical protein